MQGTLGRIGRASLVRPQKEGAPPYPEIEVILYLKDDSGAPLPPNLTVTFHFAQGMGHELWVERERRIDSPTIHVVTVVPTQKPSLGLALLQTGTDPSEAEGLTIRDGDEELTLYRDSHPDGVMFHTKEDPSASRSATAN